MNRLLPYFSEQQINNLTMEEIEHYLDLEYNISGGLKVSPLADLFEYHQEKT